MSKKSEDKIIIKGARVHNLKNIDVEIPRDQLVVITGLSGSGKSSLAFDTIYAEGQRRYVESLSSYARQFLGIMNKPDADSIKGLSPAISIEQKSISHNPRSTVGTITEVYDYLRLLYARIGVPHCPLCGREIFSQDAESITKSLLKEFAGYNVKILSPLVRGKKGHYEELFVNLNRQGYAKVRVDGVLGEVSEYIGQGKKNLQRYAAHNIEVLVGSLTLENSKKSRLQNLVETALKLSDGLIMAVLEKPGKTYNTKKKPVEINKIYSQHLACPDCDLSFEKLQPRLFSFNTPFGACPTCHGLGFIQKFDKDLIIPDNSLSLADGAIKPKGFSNFGVFRQMLEKLADEYNFKTDVPVSKLSEETIELLMYGTDDKIDWRFDSSTTDTFWEWTGRWEGVIPRLERLYKNTDSESRRAEMEVYMIHKPCGACKGARLKEEALAVTVNEKNIDAVVSMTVKNLDLFLESFKLAKTQYEIGHQIIKEIRDRLGFLIDVGLEYLTLARTGNSLSGGEGQRIRLATQVGSELKGVTYILDEPSIGLHQRDNQKLIATLKDMRDIGNSVIVVEHDEETINQADYVIDIGPGAGIHGGHVVSAGTPQHISADKKSLTGDYLSGRKQIEVPDKRRKPRGQMTLLGAKQNNLKNIDISFPMEVFCCITGVSGSGKSTLVSDTLYPILAKKFYNARLIPGAHKDLTNYGYLDKVIIIDQSPIGRTPRSNPATYTGVFTYIRELFAATKEAKVRGYKAGRFSFNVDGGRCGNCSGDGTIKIEMHFLPDVYVDCEQCKGKRYNEETLQVLYKEKNISDVLNMTIEEALKFFEHIPRIKNKLQTLHDVGLSYVKLGQSATTLSGGEAQRMKLSAELARRDTGRTLYILDEPTTGLHFDDIKKLLKVLNKLVDRGNTVYVIEHNMDVIKSADWLIDLGPEGGDGGGEIVATGTPETVSKESKSHTGKFLKKILNAK